MPVQINNQNVKNESKIMKAINDLNCNKNSGYVNVPLRLMKLLAKFILAMLF